MSFEKETKGQAGIVIVISILLLTLTLLFVIFAITNTFKDKMSYEQSLDFNVYRNSVVNCLNQKLENALFLATRQGSYIYNTQSGKTPLNIGSNLFIHYQALYVPYYIDSMTSTEPTSNVNERVPGFPFNCSEPYDKEHNNITNYKDDCTLAFNMNSLVKIASGSEERISKIIADKLEKNIRTYLTNKAKECIIESNNAFEVINKKPDELNVSVFINRYDIKAVVHYPITIRKKGGPETKTFEDFKARIDGRFRDLFNLIEEVVYNETHFTNYEPHYFNNGFEVRVLKSPDSSKPFDDIIEFVDNKTVIFGESLTFRIGRRNRAPIFYEMPKAPSGSSVRFMINFSWYEPFSEKLNDILTSPSCDDALLKGNLSYFFYNLTGFIKAIDPDQDNLTYTDNIKNYKCISQPPYFNYNVSDGEYTIEVYAYLDYGS